MVNENQPSHIPSDETGNDKLDTAPSFTPAPWVVERSVDKRSGLTVRAPQSSRNGAPNPAVCRVYDVLKEREANARLIAASPTMYEALQAAVHALRSYQHGNCETQLAQEVADAADAALLLATKGNEDGK